MSRQSSRVGNSVFPCLCQLLAWGCKQCNNPTLFPLFLGRYTLTWLWVSGSMHCCPGYFTGELFYLLLWFWGMSQTPQPSLSRPVPGRGCKKRTGFQASRCSKWGIRWIDNKAGKDHYEQAIGKVKRFSWTLNMRILKMLDCTWLRGLSKPNQHNQTNRKDAKKLVLKCEEDTTEVIFQNRVKQSQNKMKQQICLCIYSRMFPCVLISLAASPLLLRWWHRILSGKRITHLLEVTIKISSLWYITVLKAKIYYNSRVFIFIWKINKTFME